MPTAIAPLTAAVTLAAAVLLANLGGSQASPKPTKAVGETQKERNAVSPEAIAFIDPVFPAIAIHGDGRIDTLVFIRNSTDQDLSVVPVVVLRSASGVALAARGGSRFRRTAARTIGSTKRRLVRRVSGRWKPSARSLMHREGARVTSRTPGRRKKGATTPTRGLAGGAACRGQSASA
jgi:hypothetical protein